jgi:hypothetical protein
LRDDKGNEAKGRAQKEKDSLSGEAQGDGAGGLAGEFIDCRRSDHGDIDQNEQRCPDMLFLFFLFVGYL